MQRPKQIVRELYWIAVYEDGKTLPQFEEDGKENKYADIDREKLVRLDVIETATNKAIYCVYIREGQRLIFRRRTLKPLDARKPDVVVFMIGWQMTIMTEGGARNITALNYFYADGSIALDGARSNLELLQEEQ